MCASSGVENAAGRPLLRQPPWWMLSARPALDQTEGEVHSFLQTSHSQHITSHPSPITLLGQYTVPSSNLCLVLTLSSCPIPVSSLSSTHAELGHQVGTLPPLSVCPGLSPSFLPLIHYLWPLLRPISSKPRCANKSDKLAMWWSNGYLPRDMHIYVYILKGIF